MIDRWQIRSNWEPHIRQFATDNIDDLEVIQGPGGSRSEVFEFTDRAAKEMALPTIMRRIAKWIELYIDVYPLEDDTAPKEDEE